jgi:hypothetical protein
MPGSQLPSGVFHAEKKTMLRIGRRYDRPPQNGNCIGTLVPIWERWDHTHNDIEVFDKRGRHLGSMDPTTGEMYKPPVAGRKM